MINVKIYLSKNAVGAELIGGEFEFALYDSPNLDVPVDTARNNAAGLIELEAEFTHTGEFEYFVKEIEAPQYWIADTEVYPVKIEITDDEGPLEAHVSYPNGLPGFVNRLDHDTCGLVEFPPQFFEKPDRYEFTIEELTESGDGWITDYGKSFKVIVNVEDDGFGNLFALVEYPDGFPTFTNTYKPSVAHIILSACKIAVGADLPPGKFEFGLRDASGTLIATTRNK